MHSLVLNQDLTVFCFLFSLAYQLYFLTFLMVSVEFASYNCNLFKSSWSNTILLEGWSVYLVADIPSSSSSVLCIISAIYSFYSEYIITGYIVVILLFWKNRYVFAELNIIKSFMRSSFILSLTLLHSLCRQSLWPVSFSFTQKNLFRQFLQSRSTGDNFPSVFVCPFKDLFLITIEGFFFPWLQNSRLILVFLFFLSLSMI